MAQLTLQYRTIRERIAADPASYDYTDEALQPVTAEHPDHIVDFYADNIPEDPRRTATAPPR